MHLNLRSKNVNNNSKPWNNRNNDKVKFKNDEANKNIDIEGTYGTSKQM